VKAGDGGSGSGGSGTTSSTDSTSTTGGSDCDGAGGCVDDSCATAGLTACNGECVDTTKDAAHCGDCATSCGTCGTCQAGVCVSDLPAPGTITPGGATCALSKATFTIDALAGAASYTWTAPDGAVIVDGQGTTQLTVTLGDQSGQVCVTAVDSCGLASAQTCLDVTTNPTHGAQAFDYTGADQSFVVPECASQLTIEAWGAQGGGSVGCDAPEEDGGLGGYAVGTMPVTPGQTLYVMVGQKGGMGPAPASFNGGGPSGEYGGSGGGASDVRTDLVNLATRLLVAGGGGGGDTGCPNHGTGGPGGGLAGGPGVSLQSYPIAGGGSQNGGGAAGQNSSPGTLGLGGGTGAYHESGGGGGYYGGGGAYAAGGGGGSCFLGNASNASCMAGVQMGDGKIVLTW
jgi:hypothetical protein